MSFTIKHQNKENEMLMKFKDAPVGARFKNEYGNIWVKLNSNLGGDGLVVRWMGNIEGSQQKAIWVSEEDGVTYDTEIELIWSVAYNISLYLLL